MTTIWKRSYFTNEDSWASKSQRMMIAAMKLRHLLLRRKAMRNLDNVFTSRDITWLSKYHAVKAMVFPVVMYGCESWTIKKAEFQRIDAFELCCWRRRMRVPWTARKSNQSILKEINLRIHWKDWSGWQTMRWLHSTTYSMNMVVVV